MKLPIVKFPPSSVLLSPVMLRVRLVLAFRVTPALVVAVLVRTLAAP